MPVYRGPVAIIYTTACNKIMRLVKLSDSLCEAAIVQRESHRYYVTKGQSRNMTLQSV